MTADPAKQLPGRAWLVVGLLWGMALLNYLDRLTITTMHDAVKADIAMTDSQFGLLTSIFLWVYAFSSPLGGFLADRIGRTPVILGSLFVWSVLTWATGHMHSVQGLMIARGLMGVSEGCYIPTALALIADYHRGGSRSLATGIHMSGIYAGAALGGIGGQIAEHHGWRVAFSWFGYVGVAYGILALFLLRDAPKQPVAPGGTGAAQKPQLSVAVRSLLGRPAYWVFMITFCLVSIANWGVYGWLPTYLRDHFQLGMGASGITATGYVQVASFLGVIVGGFWADRWSRSLASARSKVPGIGYLIAGPCLFLAIGSQSLAIAVGGLVLYGLARGFYDANAMPIVRATTDERYSATGYGLLNLLGCAAGGLMVYAGGWLKDAQVDLAIVFRASAAALVVTGILLIFLRSGEKKAA